jgi:homeobox protein cut-like
MQHVTRLTECVAYQTYIDLISNQTKTIHGAFLQIYTPLAEAPDPYPLLEASVDSLVTAEETLPRITEENQRLQKQVSSLTDQLEQAEQKLEQERTARQELESTRDEKIKSIESTWSAVLTEKQDNWEAKEKSLEEKVENQDRLLKELKASYEVSQRLNRGEDADADNARSGATAAELEIVSSELDRANLRLAEVEARNEQLRLELAQSASSSGSSKFRGSVEDDPAYLRLQSENSSLMRRVENWRFEKDTDKRKWESDLRGLEREINTMKKDRDGLKEKMHQWSDYDNLKRELEVLKVRSCCITFLQLELTFNSPSSLLQATMTNLTLRKPRYQNKTAPQTRARA